MSMLLFEGNLLCVINNINKVFQAIMTSLRLQCTYTIKTSTYKEKIVTLQDIRRDHINKK